MDKDTKWELAKVVGAIVAFIVAAWIGFQLVQELVNLFIQAF